MPYVSCGEFKGKLVGSFKGEEIPRKQQSTIVHYAKKMKSRPTAGEAAFYRIADRINRRSKTFGSGKVEIRFAKQREFFIAQGFSFIVDCYFKKFKLGVEIDGKSHSSFEAKERDEWRSRLLLEGDGVRIIRFTNDQVINEPALVSRLTVEEMLKVDNFYSRHLRKCWEFYDRDLWKTFSRADGLSG